MSKSKKKTGRLAISGARPSYSAGEIATREEGMGFSLNGMPLPNPDLVLKRLGKDITAYEELLVDAHVGGCVDSRKAGTLSLNWAIDRGKARTDAAEIVEDTFLRLDTRRIISEILDAPLFGYNVSEVIWSSIGEIVRPLDIRQKPQTWFQFGENAELRFKSTKEPVLGEAVPPRKFLKTVHGGGWRNPYGFPVMSKIFWPAIFKKGGFKLWMMFTEKYGMPHIVARVPRGKVDEESPALLNILEQMVQDAIAVIPDDASIEIKDYVSGAGASDNYERFINNCKGEISVGLLGQTLTTDVGERGSYAAANTHMKVRKDIVDTDKALVESTLNQLAQWIVDFNMPGATAPRVGLYAQEDVDLNLAQRDETLTRQGVRLRKNYYQRAYGLQADDFDLAEPAGAMPAGAFAGKAQLPQAPAAAADAPDTMAAGLTPEELQGMMEGILKPIMSVLKSATSYEEIQKALNKAYPEMDAATFRETLAQAIFVNEILAKTDKTQKSNA